MKDISYMWDDNENVKIDLVHADLIFSLVIASKPVKVLEMGLGGGRSVDAVLEGLVYNQQAYDYTLVDNWGDWGYQMPDGVVEKYKDMLKIVTSNEKDFVFSCNEKYDFIISDADHGNTEKWFEHVYDNLLADDGILIYHDVNLFDNDYLNLREIYYTAKAKGYSYKLFNKNSLPHERCQRGLMVIYKNA